MTKAPTQESQVIEKLRESGGYATLRRLNEIVDFSAWKTKTPEASVRRIVQNRNRIFRIQPGLWALEDVIWFNRRGMPSDFYEVEHTTDIKNSLSKFYELQDFHSGFHIVADSHRRKEFDDKLHISMFDAIVNRVKFIDYNRVVEMYEGLQKVKNVGW